VEYRANYLPAESDTGMFGGNSNWRAPRMPSPPTRAAGLGMTRPLQAGELVVSPAVLLRFIGG
jgi:hypothetical protein